MAYYFINSLENPIDENDCIGDSLDTLNNNYLALDSGAWALSSAFLELKQNYNTLIQSLTSFAQTEYTSLSTSLIQLSSLQIP